MSAEWVNWLIAAGLGAVIGATDVISRYRDEPDNALFTLPAMLYLALNAGASALTYLVIRIFGWTFGIIQPELVGLGQAVVAGIGAMAILRASLFTVQIGENNVPVGPSRLLDSILDAVQQSIDRRRGEARSATVIQIMQDVDFNRAYQALPAYCFALLQNLAEAEKDKFGKKIALLYNAEMSPKVKSLLLGLALLNLIGEKVLALAVRDLGDEIKVLPPPPAPQLPVDDEDEIAAITLDGQKSEPV